MTDDVRSTEVRVEVVDATGATATATATATAILRVNLAVRHLLAAAHFSRQVGSLEKENSGQSSARFGIVFFTMPQLASSPRSQV